MRPLPLLSAALLGLAATASAYYPFLHYAGRTGPFTPIPEKFDLAALPNKTVPVLVSQSGPAKVAPGDSFTAILSEVRFAASAWNSIGSSDLRVSYQGMAAAGSAQNSPRIDVLFEELPPGLLAMGGPTARAEAKESANGAFVPITRSVLILNPDLSQWPSYTESFFSTTLHEMGHALGLQHTFTSSAMSTMVTRSSTRARPLGDDDVAALSALYPTGDFARQRGAISGQVARAGQPAALASVVAIAPGRGAVSALTNPDGTYRIDGLAPGQYYVYVHPLPPSAQADLGPGEIVLPVDPEGKPFPASDPFETVFFPGVKDLQQATLIAVTAAGNTEGVNFSVNPKADVGLYGVTTYSYPLQVAVQPAYLNPEDPLRAFFVATAYNTALTAGGAPAPGLSVAVLGEPSAVQGIKAYTYSPECLQVDIAMAGLEPGPRHVIFSRNGDLYVLPSGFFVVQSRPPSIASATPAFDAGGQRIVNIVGTNLRADTRFYFDGLPARRIGTAEDGTISLEPPAAPAGYTAAVIALNADGQSSLFAQTPPTFTYDQTPAASISTASVSLVAGSETMVEIAGTNTRFAEGITRVSFATGDISVKRAQVISPTEIRVQIAVSPAATPGPVWITATTGFEALTDPAMASILPAEMGSGFLSSEIENFVPEHTTIFPGATGVLSVSVGALRPEAVVSINGTPVPSTLLSASKIAFQVPNEITPGLAVVRLAVREYAWSALVRIERVPPVIASMWTGAVPIDAAHPVKPGDTLVVLFAGASEVFASQKAVLSVGNVAVSAPEPVASTSWAGYFTATFPIPPGVPAGTEVSCALIANGVTSLPFKLPVGPAAETPAAVAP